MTDLDHVEGTEEGSMPFYVWVLKDERDCAGTAIAAIEGRSKSNDVAVSFSFVWLFYFLFSGSND